MIAFLKSIFSLNRGRTETKTVQHKNTKWMTVKEASDHFDVSTACIRKKTIKKAGAWKTKKVRGVNLVEVPLDFEPNRQAQSRIRAMRSSNDRALLKVVA